MTHLDCTPRFRCALEVLADLVMQSNFALLDQQHDASGYKLFAYRSDFKDRVSLSRNIKLNIGKPVTLSESCLATLFNRQRNPGIRCLVISALTYH